VREPRDAVERQCEGVVDGIGLVVVQQRGLVALGPRGVREGVAQLRVAVDGPGDLEQLSALQQQINDYLREMAERQGIEEGKAGFQMTPKAFRLFQSRLLTAIFTEMQASRSGRHQGPIIGEGATELQATKTYEFGDSVAHMDIPQTVINSLIRSGAPLRLKSEDIVIHRTRNNPKCASVVLLDMSGSMRYAGLYVNVKRMGLALDGLIRSEYPGDLRSSRVLAASRATSRRRAALIAVWAQTFRAALLSTPLNTSSAPWSLNDRITI